MTEVASYPLASHENVRGGVVLGDQVFFWTPQGAWLIGDPAGRRQVRCPGPMGGVLGVGMVQAKLLALDTLDSGIFEVDSNGTCRRLHGAQLHGLIAAAPTDSGWLLLQRDALRRAQLLLAREPALQDLDTLPWPPILADTADAAWFFLASQGGGVLFGNHHHPSDWTFLDPVGKLLVRSQVADEPPQSPLFATAGEQAMWHALVPVSVSPGYLRVLADLASDHRRVLLFDREGHLARASEIEAPIGFFASDTASQRLAGIRIADQVELVIYVWRWETTRTKEAL